MQSILAGWRLSLRRTRADWPIVAAAWLITLLATVLFAAGPIYSSAAALAGLRRTLDESSPTAVSVQVSLYGTPDYVSGVDKQVSDDLRGALSPLPAPITRDGRGAASLGLPSGDGVQTQDRALLGFLDGLPDHAHLVAGAWPQTGTSDDPLQVVLLDSVATELQLKTGDELTLVAPTVGKPTDVPVQVVGTYAVDDEADPYWNEDAQLTAGLTQTGQDRVIGPFMAAPERILAMPVLNSIHVVWRAFPDFDELSVDNVASVHNRVDALAGRLKATIAGSVGVATDLPAILGAAEKSLLVSRTEVLLVMAQLAIMAAYAIVLTASLLVDHRQVETALLRSRGAGPAQIAWLAFAEGLLLVVPAVLVAPWLAVAQTTVLEVAGPLADIGLKIQPKVTVDAYLLAIAAGIVCLALLVLPAVLAARNLAAADRDLSRQETRTFGHRMGLDLALLAVSIIALWQLRLYGAPLTRTVQGSLGFDPLLVAAPALGLLAGGILALRILPYLASAMESWMSRGRTIVASLGSRQLARRPLRYTRTALLLMLSLSLGVFALSYSATWTSSQQDQAAYQAGADVRATAVHQAGQSSVLPAAYTSVPGVETAMPVERIENGIPLTDGNIDLLALEPDAASSIVHFRSDEASQPLPELMTALGDGRPNLALASLPPDAEFLRVNALLDISTILSFPDPGSSDSVELDPATLTGLRANATATVRDARGLIYRLSSSDVEFTDKTAAIVMPLKPAAATASLEGPLQLAAVDVVVSLPRDTLVTSARVGVSDLAASASADGPWSAIPSDAWAARMASGRAAPKAVSSSSLSGMVVQIGGAQGEPFINGGVNGGRVFFISSAIDSLGHDDATVPVIANPALLSATGTAVGQTIDMTVDRLKRHLSIAGVVDSFPTTDPSRPLLIFDQPTLDLLRLQATSTNRNVDEWWLSVAPGASDQVAAALREEPFDHSDVVSADGRARGLSTDPVALGIIGALLLGFVATGIFALVALVVSAAVSARQRRTEFALMRALGLSGRQLSGWLWLENGSLVVVSLIAGTLLGIVISLIALPFITVTQQATTPIPGVLVQMPWDRILMLDVVVLIALGVAVGILAAVLRRIGVGSILRLGGD